MKKTVIGSILMLSGVFISVSIIIAAALYAPSTTSWSGSKLWFAIFGARQCGYGSKQCNEKGRQITNAFSNVSTESKGNSGELVSLTYGVINNFVFGLLKAYNFTLRV